MSYKITVIGTSDEKYLVGHYYKTGEEIVPDFASVISKICDYAQKPEVFNAEPCLRYLTEAEETAVRQLRNLVLEQRVEQNTS